jgi:hydroxymethylpyrimidine pyrophosphatase-like HAD family hydrolase
VAFGDMPNDLEMLRWAGRSYAVADGHPGAREAADDLAPACGDDGVAQVLERLLSWRAR